MKRAIQEKVAFVSLWATLVSQVSKGHVVLIALLYA